MINLSDEKDYYILVDGEGGAFGGGCILEGLGELLEVFRGWADNDNYSDPQLTDWTLCDLMDNWTMTIKKYDGSDFVELSESEMNIKI